MHGFNAHLLHSFLVVPSKQTKSFLIYSKIWSYCFELDIYLYFWSRQLCSILVISISNSFPSLKVTKNQTTILDLKDLRETVWKRLKNINLVPRTRNFDTLIFLVQIPVIAKRNWYTSFCCVHQLHSNNLPVLVCIMYTYVCVRAPCQNYISTQQT